MERQKDDAADDETYKHNDDKGKVDVIQLLRTNS